MQRSVVKFFIVDRGYGFLTPEDGGPDVFIHVKELHKAGIKAVAEGQPLLFEMGAGRDGKPKAVKVELVQ